MARDTLAFSHWYHLNENLQQSSKEFYNQLTQAIQKRKLPKVSLSQIYHKEGGVVSAKREYLRVKREEYIFDICAAPYGNGFFVSWWLGEKISLLRTIMLSIPFLGAGIVAVFKPFTYYRMDAAMMFQESIHMAVLEVLEGIIEAKGLKALSETERKPIMKDFLKNS